MEFPQPCCWPSTTLSHVHHRWVPQLQFLKEYLLTAPLFIFSKSIPNMVWKFVQQDSLVRASAHLYGLALNGHSWVNSSMEMPLGPL